MSSKEDNRHQKNNTNNNTNNTINADCNKIQIETTSNSGYLSNSDVSIPGSWSAVLSKVRNSFDSNATCMQSNTAPYNSNAATDGHTNDIVYNDGIHEKSDEYRIVWSRGRLFLVGTSLKYYVGYDSVSNMLLAAKEVPLTNVSNIPTKLAKTKNDIKRLRDLNHRNILQYKGVANTREALYIVSEFVPGGVVRDLLDYFGPFSEHVAAVYMMQLLEGVVYVHSKGVILHNIKCSNILVSTSGVLKFLDFGFALSFDEVMKSPERRTWARWMSPETVRAEGITCAVDIWSIGCTLLEMLTGKCPFHHLGSVFSVMTCVGNPDLEMSLPPEIYSISGNCRDFLRKCFTKYPSDRPSAAALLGHPFFTDREWLVSPREVTPREVTPREVTSYNSKDNISNNTEYSVFEQLNSKTREDHQISIYEQACVGVPLTKSDSFKAFNIMIDSDSTGPHYSASDISLETSKQAEEMIYNQIYAQEKMRFDNSAKGLQQDICDSHGDLSNLIIKIGTNIIRNTANQDQCSKGDKLDSRALQIHNDINRKTKRKKCDNSNTVATTVTSTKENHSKDVEMPLLVDRKKTEDTRPQPRHRQRLVTITDNETECEDRAVRSPEPTIGKYIYSGAIRLYQLQQLEDMRSTVVVRMKESDDMTLLSFVPITKPCSFEPRTANCIVGVTFILLVVLALLIIIIIVSVQDLKPGRFFGERNMGN